MNPYGIALIAFALVGTGCASQSHALGRETAATVSDPGASAVAVVRVKAPWYAPRFVIRGRFRDAVPEYEALGALESKYFTISDDGQFGGIYRWATRGDAEAYYSETWRHGIRERRGVEPDLRVFDAPFLVHGRTTIEGPSTGSRSISYPATATLVLWPSARAGTEPDLARRVADQVKDLDGLVRAAVLVSPTHIGFAALWATREVAENALRPDALQARESQLGVPRAEVTYFEAPVLIDASLRGNAR
jgi:hypothetical protein